ncbi:hypothetical protein [Bradyrhizobium sp. CCGE-LA001]|uniref:hypothetical protein n=1 Tax=Bradyrhizobium sp. CCGE-LA001 TaxID=1223566 RepID=UPI0002AA9593|nr:hypothetical protein [Bradyrhizobium sp. CCGE-LA001]AMA59837.1 hypothetical protein BCCGELA001_28645 [Bradyrhizobium sp. CCGE-LA001]
MIQNTEMKAPFETTITIGSLSRMLVTMYFLKMLTVVLSLVAGIDAAMAEHPGYRGGCSGILVDSPLLLADKFRSEGHALDL